MKRHDRKSALLGLSAMATVLSVATPAWGQDAPAVPDQATPTQSADANDSGYTDIVVTAQKRSEAAQDVPISLSAFDSAALVAAGVTAPGDLQRIAPTFKFTSSIGTLAARFSIRGVGTFSNSAIEPSVATFINGIYVPRPASIVNSLLDISAVEVLSGPQGTLFGRNASVGAVSFRTADPEDVFSGNLRSEYSTGNRFRTEGAINLPISSNTAIRIAGLADVFDGYWKDGQGNRFGGLDTYQGRATIKSELSDNLTWTVRGEYQQNKGDGLLNAQLVPSTLSPTTLANITAAQGGIAPTLDLYSRRNNAARDNAYVDDSIWGLSSDLSYTTGSDFTIRLLNGYYNWDSKQGDGDTASLSVYVLGRDLRYNSESHSHELQFISPKGLLDGKLDFVGGLYYFHEDLGILADSLNGPSFCTTVIPRINAAAFPGLPGTDTASRIAACQTYTGPSTRGDFDQSTRSLAAYGQATFKLLPTLDLTGGIRYTDEKKSGSYIGTVFNPTGAILAANETTALKLKDDRFTWRANLAWHPGDDIMLFATASTGFKSGGFNNGIATAVLGQNRVFQAETVTNYEFGIKSQFLNRKLTFNATAYRMDIDNFQERSILNTTSTIRNVGKVRQQGVEFELVARPTRNVKFNASIAYLDSEILSYCNAPRPPYLPAIAAPTPTAKCPTLSANTQDLSGARLSYTPEWSGTVGLEVGTDIGGSGMRWTANGDINFVSDQLMGTTIDNSALTAQDGYALLNGRITLYGPQDNWSLSVFGRNLTDKGYCASKVYQVLEGPLGLRYDTNGVPGNDATAVRCNVAAPRVIGLAGSIKF